MGMVTIHEAKTHLSRLLQKASNGEEIIISHGSKPVARLVLIGEIKGQRRPGALKDKLLVGPKFFEALPVAELFAWE